MLHKIILLQVLLACLPIFAKKEVKFQLWEDNFHTISLNEKYSITNRIGLRIYDFERPSHRLEYRPNVNYLWQNKHKIKAGVGLFYYKTESKYKAMEYRPWLGFSTDNKLGDNAILSHNLRWENRWYSKYAPFESRFRYQLKLGTKVYDKGEKEVKIALAPEFFYSVGSFEEFSYKSTRFAVSTSYKHSQRLSFEALPMLLASHNNNIAHFDDHYWVVQLKLKYKMTQKL